MDSLLDRTKDADLDQLLKEFAERAHGNRRRSLRLRAWKFTVFGAYAAKRAIDIAGSALGLILLSPVFLAIAAAVEALVADAVAKIGAAIDAMSIPRLAGVVLGGGYGRGEGGAPSETSPR